MTDGLPDVPLLSGALICAQTILEDLLTIRADRDFVDADIAGDGKKPWDFSFFFLRVKLRERETTHGFRNSDSETSAIQKLPTIQKLVLRTMGWKRKKS